MKNVCNACHCFCSCNYASYLYLFEIYVFSRKEKQSSIANGLTSSGEAAPAFQSPTECGSSGDAAFRWRKYGQKAVNGNSFPR